MVKQLPCFFPEVVAFGPVFGSSRDEQMVMFLQHVGNIKESQSPTVTKKIHSVFVSPLFQ